jgi:hypothetical protein
MESTELFAFNEPKLKIVCPKHGTHDQYINSTVKGYEGNWCMLCWLESLGNPLPTIEE